MMKWVVIPVLAALMLQTTALPFLALRLEIERETVAIPRCINKARTDLQCLGSCYINEHLKAALDQTDQQSGETTLPQPPTSTTSPQLLTPYPNWVLRTPPRSPSILHPQLAHWDSGDYRRPSWEPPRA